MDKLLTPEEVCDRYHITMNTLYRWTSKESIPFFKRGGLKFKEDDLNKWESKGPALKLI